MSDDVSHDLPTGYDEPADSVPDEGWRYVWQPEMRLPYEGGEILIDIARDSESDDAFVIEVEDSSSARIIGVHVEMTTEQVRTLIKRLRSAIEAQG